MLSQTIIQQKVIRYLRIQFKGELKFNEISAFRGGIINKAGKKHILFHNHTGDSTFLYKYPRIQYKAFAQKPGIICLEQGVDEIHHLFQKDDWEIDFKGHPIKLVVDKIDLRNFTLQTWNSQIKYSISNWMPLNQENYANYMKLSSLKEKLAFLEKILTANILSFAKGMDWTINEKIETNILELKGGFPVQFKGKSLVGFSATFSTNVSLPYLIGLGKSVTHGFGIVRNLKTHQENL